MYSNRRVLIVEDDLDTSLTFRTFLAVLGYDVRFAFDGLHALLVADEYEPDVILLDLGLPQLDGFAVARQLRGLKHFFQPAIIVITGRLQPDDKERAYACGVDYFVHKPPDPERLQYLLAHGIHLASADSSPNASSRAPTLC